MTYEFIIVFSVAITLKLMFMSFSLYVTYKQKKEDQAQKNGDATTTKPSNRSFLISWKNLQKSMLPKVLYCPETNSKIMTNKL